jgi:hypothetical protein
MSYEIAAAKRSYYYWWWKYLRLSKNYWARCLLREPSLNEGLNRVYVNFGNVFELSFEDWWVGYGNKLFSLKLEPIKVDWANNEMIDEATSTGWLKPVIVPMFYSKTDLVRQFKNLLNDHAPIYPDSERSLSDYEVSKLRGFRKDSIINAHKVWCLNRVLEIKESKGDFERGHRYGSYWMAKKIGVNINSDILDSNTPLFLRREQAAIRVKISRYLQMANNLISNVEVGEFPVNKFNESKFWSAAQIRKIDGLGGAEWGSPELSSLELVKDLGFKI